MSEIAGIIVADGFGVQFRKYGGYVPGRLKYVTLGSYFLMVSSPYYTLRSYIECYYRYVGAMDRITLNIVLGYERNAKC